MAARVNVKFVAILCTVVGVVFVGMAGAAYFIVKKSAADHFAAGQQYEQAGNFEEAQKSYAKAVNKERTNTLYLEQWIDSIEKLTPQTQTKYADMYWKDYIPALRALAVAKRTDVEAWDRFLQTQYEQRKVFGAEGRTSWESMLSEVNTAIGYFLAAGDGSDDDAAWNRLRRYRALSNLNMMMGAGAADQDFRDKTVLDFEAALAVDPSDDEAAVGLYEWLMAEASRADGSRRDPQVYLTQARETLDGFLANNPDHPRALIARLFYDIQVDARPIRDMRTQEDRVRANIQLAESYKPRVEAMVERVLSQSDRSDFGVDVVQLVHRLERLVDPQGRIPLTDRVLAASVEAAEGRPGEIAKLDFFNGVFSADSNDYERAIAAFKRVEDSPTIPVSLDGIIVSLLKGQAVLRRTQSAIELAQRAEGEARTAAIQRVTDFRSEVSQFWPEATPSVMLLDARIAYMKGELAEAQRLAIAYQRESGSDDPQANFLLGAIYMDRNQPGEALRELERYVELQPNVPGAWAQLSSLRDRLGDRDGAMEAIEQAVQLAPDDESIRNRYNTMRAVQGMAVSDDPITQALVRVQRFVDTTGGLSPQYERAVALIRQTMALHGDDVRLYNALATILGLQGKTDDALAAIDEGLTKYPESGGLAQLRTRLRLQQGEIPDDLELTPVRRAMLEYRIAGQQGKSEAAEAALQEAIRLAPEDPEVLQIRIAMALDDEDFKQAEQLINRATELNTDQAGGRILRSTLLQAQGRLAEALSMIDSVIADGLTSVPVLYRKAQILRNMGRADAAVDVYRDILRRQPDDVTNVREVVTALAQLGRLRQALDIARSSQRVAGADPIFVDQWLKLEAEVGDATAAMLKREDIRDEQPGNRENNLALVNVYVKLGEWAKARPIIDEARAAQDDVVLAMLDARWHAEQGELGRAVATFEQYMAGRQRSGELDARDVLSYANFLQSQDQTNRAIAMLRGSLGLEPETGKPIHRRLALLLLSTGRATEAVEVIDQIIAAGDDADGTLELARAEAYVRGGLLDEAERALSSLSAKNSTSEAAGILRADLAQRRGDRRAAEKALSDTLAANPTSARAYTRRAEMIWIDLEQDDASMSDAERAEFTRNAIADLNEAVKHDPNMWEAYRLLGIIAMESKRYDDAARHVAKAIELRPGQSVLRTRLIRRLVQEGDTPRAMTIINAAVTANPADIDLQVNFARLLADLGRTGEATRLFEGVLTQRRNPEIAAQFVEFLLNQDTSTARAKARQVLSDANLNVRGTWQLQLMDAALALQEGAKARAVAVARTSFDMVRDDTSGVIRWFNAMPALIKDHAVRMEVAVQLGVDQTPQRVGEIMLASLMLQDPSTEQQGLSELRRLASDRDNTVSVRAGQLLGDTLYARKEYSGAVEAWRAVIDRDPRASQSLNNMAFVLATELDDCAAAIDLARRAIEIGGVAPAIARSTLVVALLECDRTVEAQQVAEELNSLAKGTPEEALAAIRLGEVALKQGKMEEARGYADQARAVINAWGDRAQAYESILQSFEDALG